MDIPIKQMPFGFEAEQSVLGSMITSNMALALVFQSLKTEDFYYESHKLIFEAIKELFERSQPVDLVTVSEALRDKLDIIGGFAYLAFLANSVITTENLSRHIEIIKDKSNLRKLINAANEISTMSYEEAEDTQLILDSAEQKIFSIAQSRSNLGITHIKGIIVETVARLEELKKAGSKITGVETGFTELDQITAGFQKSDLILIAARPAMGKTAFALNLAQHAAIKKNVPVAIFNLEMSKEQLVNRILCSEAYVESSKMRTGEINTEDMIKIARAIGSLTSAPIYIDDTPGATVGEIKAKCRRLARMEKGLGLIVIDYLQLMQGRARSESRQQEISEISRSLKMLAKELNIPVVCLSQLSRATEGRADKRPMLSDLRESGAIEQDADIVMFLYRDEYYNKESEKHNIAECIIAKHRNGSTGTVELAYRGEYVKFMNLDKR